MKPLPLRLAPILVAAAIPLLGLKLFAIAGELAANAVQPAEASPTTQTPPAQTPPAQSPAAPAAPQPAAATEAPPPAPKPAPNTAAASDPTSFSPAEVDLLQALSQRRSELDKRTDELDGREMMLKAAEQRIAEKIAALQKMEKSIDDMLQKKDDENAAKLKNIVRIYEIMKPQEAARIFEELDMPVLLDVVENMKEAKAAPILANMQPQKAKALTLALAERRLVPKP